jgi:hypothetical protein
MPFGLQGAPGVFQEMMEILCQQVRQKLKSIKNNAFLGALFDDCGIGTDTEEQHLIILKEFFEVCSNNHIRIKLSKCDFLKEHLEYLGFEIGWKTWRPSKKKCEAILRTEIRTLSDLRSFLGAANFYRRHIPNFTYSSAILTDKLKKNNNWVWGEQEQRCFDELRQKLGDAQELGVPARQGERYR